MYKLPHKRKNLTKQEQLELIKRVQAGDSSALHDLVVSEQWWLIGLALRCKFGATIPEDAIGEAFAELLKAATSLNLSRNIWLKTYSSRIIRFRVVKYCKNDLLFRQMLQDDLEHISDPTMSSVLDHLIHIENIMEAVEYLADVDDIHWHLLETEAYHGKLRRELGKYGMTKAEFTTWKEQKRQEIEMRNKLPLYVCKDKNGRIATVLCKGWRSVPLFLKIVDNEADELWGVGKPRPKIMPSDIYEDYFICMGPDKYRTAARGEPGRFAGTACDIHWERMLISNR
jgi:hypothetical protein